MNKDELEARNLCAKCNYVNNCEECMRIDCEEWRHYLDNPNTFKGKILCFLGLHDWYEYRSSRLMKCKRCGCTRERMTEIELNIFMYEYYRNEWLRYNI
jgi:hypothetical protein